LLVRQTGGDFAGHFEGGDAAEQRGDAGGCMQFFQRCASPDRSLGMICRSLGGLHRQNRESHQLDRLPVQRIRSQRGDREAHVEKDNRAGRAEVSLRMPRQFCATRTIRVIVIDAFSSTNMSLTARFRPSTRRPRTR